ncbi:IS30 family transposase [Sphingomonas zeicaulis]
MHAHCCKHLRIGGGDNGCRGAAAEMPAMSARVLSLAEREEISRGAGAFAPLDRCPTRPVADDDQPEDRAHRRSGPVSRCPVRLGGVGACAAPQGLQVGLPSELAPKSAAKLRRKWSPQQIASWIGGSFANQEQQRVSHATIYKSLYIQARGVLKQELLEHLRAKRTIRRPRHASLKGDGLAQIKDAVPISARPASVEDRAVPGHWEGDLIAGARGSHVVTLVDRRSRYVILANFANRQTATVVSALIGQARKLPGELCRSLTLDRGKELADHRRFTLASNVQVYFCDPQSPWQRGTNENTNRLLRQYLPKGIDLSTFSQARLGAIHRRLNEQPSKTVNYQTPAETFARAVAATD